MNITAPRVAILASSEQNQQRLSQLLEAVGLHIAVCGLPCDNFLSLLEGRSADVILVDLTDENGKEIDVIDALLDYDELPILFNDSSPSGDAATELWAKKLARKLALMASAYEHPKPAQALHHAVVETALKARIKNSVENITKTNVAKTNLATATQNTDAPHLAAMPESSINAENSHPEMVNNIPTQAPVATTFSAEPLPQETTTQTLPFDDNIGSHENSTEKNWDHEESAASRSDAEITPPAFDFSLVDFDAHHPKDEAATETFNSNAESTLSLLPVGHVAETSAATETAPANSFESTLTLQSTNRQETSKKPQAAAINVWLLGASLGGPQAVRQFLAALKSDLPVAFILAQHIGGNHIALLAEQLDRITSFKVLPGSSGYLLRHHEVLIAPADNSLRITDDGCLALLPPPANPVYSPSIDNAMRVVAEHYQKMAGTIIFSGMGNDGALGCKDIAQYGGIVWAQDAASCVISSMPDQARKTGSVTFSANPRALADKLYDYYQDEPHTEFAH
jgi:chemotaxis response regulator CheB